MKSTGRALTVYPTVKDITKVVISKRVFYMQTPLSSYNHRECSDKSSEAISFKGGLNYIVFSKLVPLVSFSLNNC